MRAPTREDSHTFTGDIQASGDHLEIGRWAKLVKTCLLWYSEVHFSCYFSLGFQDGKGSLGENRPTGLKV